MTRIVKIPSGGVGNFEYQTEITTNTTLTTEKGLNKVYPVNSSSAAQITVPEGVYVENDVINFERRGEGSVEFIGATDNVRLRGVRDVDNRYFIDSTYSWVALVCRGSNEFSVIGRLTDGYTGAVTTSNYEPFIDGATNVDVEVTGTGFSDNMLVSFDANATLNSFTVNSATSLTLNITVTGSLGDDVIVTYDNGDVSSDTVSIAAAWASDIFASYRLESSAVDQVGSLNGTSTLVSYVSGGVVGDCADFSASNTSSVRLPDDDLFSFGNGTTDTSFSIAISAYWNVAPSAGGEWIINKRDDVVNQSEWQISANSTAVNFALLDQSASATLGRSASWTPSINTWYNFVFTYDGSGSRTGMKIYIDAVQSDDGDFGSGTYTAMENTTSLVTIGKRGWDNTSGDLDGLIDEVNFFNSELTSSQVTQVNNTLSSGNHLV